MFQQLRRRIQVKADAPVLAPVVQLLRRLKDSGTTIVICSGRPSGWAEHTAAWLNKNDIPFGGLYLRAADIGQASDPEVKRALLREMCRDGFDP